MQAETFFQAGVFNRKGNPGFHFNDLDLPTIYRLAQHTFGRDFINLSVKGITVREQVDAKRLRKFIGIITEFYNPTRVAKPVSLNLQPVETKPVALKKKQTPTAYVQQ